MQAFWGELAWPEQFISCDFKMHWISKTDNQWWANKSWESCLILRTLNTLGWPWSLGSLHCWSANLLDCLLSEESDQCLNFLGSPQKIPSQVMPLSRTQAQWSLPAQTLFSWVQLFIRYSLNWLTSWICKWTRTYEPTYVQVHPTWCGAWPILTFDLHTSKKFLYLDFHRLSCLVILQWTVKDIK